MRVRSHDQGYVAAAPDEVYEAVADLSGYAGWWPEVRVRQRGDGVRLALDGPRGVTVTTTRHRPGIGLVLEFGPPLSGTLEWYLERWEEGTIVNVILDVELPGGPGRAARRLLRIRARIRRGMVGLKEALE